MIRYALICENEDAFEGWFRNSAEYDAQLMAGQLRCPICASADVRKAPMAPAVIGRGAREASLETLRQHVQDHCEYVGEEFAHEARAMHEGDAPERAIWGEATPGQAIELLKSGAPIAPLPLEAIPSHPKRARRLN